LSQSMTLSKAISPDCDLVLPLSVFILLSFP
jgi:hypothetical protein